ncbi:unnamed protein product [Lactuca saligna]|uniref:GAG-pre-integrase domain-containing protein n=1 Tax=Lactuca saligna TaxID=75948 RepID=A0AA35ZKS4_LACSI|nr:unnamed protein product [Lactuca saligna]
MAETKTDGPRIEMLKNLQVKIPIQVGNRILHTPLLVYWVLLMHHPLLIVFLDLLLLFFRRLFHLIMLFRLLCLSNILSCHRHLVQQLLCISSLPALVHHLYNTSASNTCSHQLVSTLSCTLKLLHSFDSRVTPNNNHPRLLLLGVTHKLHHHFTDLASVFQAMSVQQTPDNNFYMDSGASSICPCIPDFKTGASIQRCDSVGDLYPIVSSPPSATTYVAVSLPTWHRRLGHPGSSILNLGSIVDYLSHLLLLKLLVYLN